METLLNSTAIISNNVLCFAPMMTATEGIWSGIDPLSFSLPLFMLQIVLIVLVTRGLALLIRPFHQPRAIAETIESFFFFFFFKKIHSKIQAVRKRNLIHGLVSSLQGGIILGPSVMGRSTSFSLAIFPLHSMLVLETFAHLGLLLFLFLIGTEMDLAVVRESGQKGFVVAVVGVVLPFTLGTTTAFLLKNIATDDVHVAAFLLFLGVTLSVTAVPVLASVLAETKLLNAEVGRLSMSAAIISDAILWILLPMSIALTVPEADILSSVWVLISGVGFLVFCFCCVRPVMWWLMQRIPEGQTLSDLHVCFIVNFMMLAAASTDIIGMYSVFGAFVFGLVIPNGPIGVALIEKLEDFVTGLLVPLYVVVSGLRADFTKVEDGKTVALLILVYVLASVGKLAGTFVISVIYTMPMREGLSLGFLMNTRGLVELIVLNIGKDHKILDEQSFSVLLLTSLIVTAVVTPAVALLNRPTRRLIGYRRRNLQRTKPDTELRVLTCVHNTRNVPSIISLLDMSNPTKRSPIFVYALHLVELTGRSSALLAVHGQDSVHQSGCRKALTGTQAQSDHIFHAFENYEQQVSGISVQTLTVVSPYTTMHEDVCGLAEDKHVTMIILPFHKQQTVDGGMEPINPAIKLLNENVITASPCSVGILVDRGLSSKGRAAHGQQQFYRTALLFFGGPDDREALALSLRVTEQPSFYLTVVRFILGSEATPPNSPGSFHDSRVLNILTEKSEDQHLDSEYMNDFRARNAANDSVLYVEKEVSSTEETVATIRAMGVNDFDLFVVGRSQGPGVSALTAGLTEWTECPELGPIGDLLASSDLAMTVSVIVVHQYVGGPLGNAGSVAAGSVQPPSVRSSGH